MSQAAANPSNGAPDAPADPEASPGSGKKKLVIVAALAVVVAAAGGGYWFWSGRQAAEGSAEVESRVTIPLQFHPIDPPLVVNFQAGSGARFLQIEVRVASRDTATIALLKGNDPLIRNDLLMLFGAQQQAELATVEGKEKLREATLQAVRAVVAREGGKADAVESVLFTSFVMQ